MGDTPAQEEVRTVKKGDQYHHPDLREAMIRVAQELLESEGPNSWTVRAAARIAGVSSGAPYRHFADKDTLLAAVAARGFEDLRTDIETHLEQAAHDPYGRFQALGEAYVSFAASRPGRYQLMFGRDILNRDHPELCAAADRAFASLLEEVERAQTAKLLRTDGAAPALAAGAWAVVHGLADLLLSGRLNDIADGDTAGLTTQLGRMMFEGLLAREPHVPA